MANVLVIDDDAVLRQIVEQALKGGGHNVLSAPEGEEGLKLMRARTIDVLICDLFMPGKEGIETILEVSRDFPQVAIIAMSGGHAGSQQMLAIVGRLGDVRILEKPFDNKTLLKTVEDAVG